MCALCATMVSLFVLGMVNESIWTLSEPALGCCRTVTLVIFWPARVTWTCIGPWAVFATVPVTVREAVAAVAPWLVPALGLVLAFGLVLAAGAAPAVAGAAGGGAAEVAPGTWVLNDSSAASPAAVPPRARTARSMKPPVRTGGQRSKDSRWMRRCGMPAARSAATAVWVMPVGPQT